AEALGGIGLPTFRVWGFSTIADLLRSISATSSISVADINSPSAKARSICPAPLLLRTSSSAVGVFNGSPLCKVASQLHLVVQTAPPPEQTAMTSLCPVNPWISACTQTQMESLAGLETPAPSLNHRSVHRHRLEPRLSIVRFLRWAVAQHRFPVRASIALTSPSSRTFRSKSACASSFGRRYSTLPTIRTLTLRGSAATVWSPSPDPPISAIPISVKLAPPATLPMTRGRSSSL